MARRIARRRRWHLKPAGVILIVALLLAILAVCCVSCFFSGGKEGDPSSASEPSDWQAGGELPGTQPVSSALSSAEEETLPEIPQAAEIPYGSFGAGVFRFPANEDIASQLEQAGVTSGAGYTFPYEGLQKAADGTGAFSYTDENGTEYRLPFRAFLESLPEGALSDWNLILLNPEEENKIDRDLDIDMTKFDTQWVDSRAASAYQAMCDAAGAATGGEGAEEGITLYLRSGYRSMATQQTNYTNNIQRLISQGVNEAEAIRQTQLYYTVPGHSEHHTGLAFDIITPEYHTFVYTLDERFGETEAYDWLVGHCADYGFVLRYARDKEGTTQINFEPWHYRYVGKEHAAFMQAYNLCFEEYVQLLKLRDLLAG